MATVVIQKREGKNGRSYAVKYRDPLTGGKKHYKTFNRMRDANQAANDLRAMLDTGDTPRKAFKMHPMTFSEIADELIKDWEKRVLLGKLRQCSCTDYTVRLRVLKRLFGGQLMGQIDPERLESYRDGIAVEKSNISANRDMFILRQVFKKAVELKATKSDPTAGIGKLSEKAHERNRFLLPHELEKLLQATGVGKSMHYLPALILLGAEHGASHQECLSLQWSDIDFSFQGSGLIRFYRTKNGRERTELLMRRTKEALMHWREHLESECRMAGARRAQTEYVFCQIKNGSPLLRFDKAFKAACRRAAIKNFHFHDLRHTFCSNLILAGAGLKDVKEMIGHADIAMTDRYSHLTVRHKQLMQQRLAEHYAGSAN